MTGRIIRLRRERGFGFVLCPDGSTVFLHASALLDVPFDDLDAGDRLSFDVVDDAGGKGPRATNVTYVRPSEVAAGD